MSCALISVPFHVSDSLVVTIASFSRQLGIIPSKQRPRKLTIHGSDGEDYAFLLKGHEDLRQDERVMQVLWLFRFPVFQRTYFVFCINGTFCFCQRDIP